jgi:hypothetical protein
MQLPVEILEEAFKYLQTRDLRECMFVYSLFDVTAHNRLRNYMHVMLDYEYEIERLLIDLLEYPRMATRVGKITLAISVKRPTPWTPVAELCSN